MQYSLRCRRRAKEIKSEQRSYSWARKFSSLMLDIKNMSNEDIVFYLLKDLDNWPPTELQRAKPKELARVISITNNPGVLQTRPSLYRYYKRKGRERQLHFRENLRTFQRRNMGVTSTVNRRRGSLLRKIQASHFSVVLFATALIALELPQDRKTQRLTNRRKWLRFWRKSYLSKFFTVIECH